MAEYIEREKAINAVFEAYADGRSAYIALETIPAADVRPVVRGGWARIDYVPHGHDYKCSACGWKNDMPTHFCPNCGAMMEEPCKEKGE